MRFLTLLALSMLLALLAVSAVSGASPAEDSPAADPVSAVPAAIHPATATSDPASKEKPSRGWWAGKFRSPRAVAPVLLELKQAQARAQAQEQAAAIPPPSPPTKPEHKKNKEKKNKKDKKEKKAKKEKKSSFPIVAGKHGGPAIPPPTEHPTEHGLLGREQLEATRGCGRSCCYGCHMKGFVCEKKCKICCPEGVAAVCDNTPSCRCEGGQNATAVHNDAPKRHSDEHAEGAKENKAPDLSRVEGNSASKSMAASLFERLGHSARSSAHSVVSSSPLRTMSGGGVPQLKANALSLTDIIIIVVVVVVVMFCCGGFGYSRYRSRSTL